MSMDPDEITSQQFPIKMRGYDPEQVEAFLNRVASDYRRVQRMAQQQGASAPARSAYEDVGDQVASILRSAAQSAEELRLAAEREAESIRSTAAEEAAMTVEAALDKLEAANKAKATAEEEADAIRAAARYDAGRMEQEARERVAKFEHDAREKAAELERAANANVAAVLAEARRRYEHLRQAERKAITRLAAVESLIARARQELPEAELEPGGMEYSSMNELDVPGQDLVSADAGRNAQQPGTNEAEATASPSPAKPAERATRPRRANR